MIIPYNHNYQLNSYYYTYDVPEKAIPACIIALEHLAPEPNYFTYKIKISLQLLLWDNETRD